LVAVHEIRTAADGSGAASHFRGALAANVVALKAITPSFIRIFPNEEGVLDFMAKKFEG
jgi:hypothetical protein